MTPVETTLFSKLGCEDNQTRLGSLTRADPVVLGHGDNLLVPRLGVNPLRPDWNDLVLELASLLSGISKVV